MSSDRTIRTTQECQYRHLNVARGERSNGQSERTPVYSLFPSRLSPLDQEWTETTTGIQYTEIRLLGGETRRQKSTSFTLQTQSFGNSREG